MLARNARTIGTRRRLRLTTLISGRSTWPKRPLGPRQLCLTATCDQWENGKSISSIDTGQASIAHGAKTDSDLARLPGVDHPAGRTDSDLARPPGGDHPAAQHASQGALTRSAARRGQSAAQRAHPRTSDTECSMQRLEDAASRTTRGSRRSRPAEDRTLSRLSGAGAER